MGKNLPFKFAHAAHADWTQAAQSCMHQLGAIPSAATLGFLYVADAFAGELDAILAFFKSATGVAHWTGSVGVGVCATGVEYLDEPAMALMLGEFAPDDFSMLPVLRTPQDIEAQPSDAYFAVVHGDPANSRIQELIEALSAHGLAGFLVLGSNGEAASLEAEERRDIVDIEPAALEALGRHPWPGNVRELRNVVHRAYVLSDPPAISSEAVEAVLAAPAPVPPGAGGAGDALVVPVRVGDTARAAERKLIEATIAAVGGDKRAAAEMLGLSLKTVYNKLRSWGGS